MDAAHAPGGGPPSAHMWVTDVKGAGEGGERERRKEGFGGDADGEEGGGEKWLRSRYTIHM